MTTHGEIENAISKGMSRFEQEYMGRGPKDLLSATRAFDQDVASAITPSGLGSF